MEKAKSKLGLVKKQLAAKKASKGAVRKKAGKNAGENSNDPGAVLLNNAAKTALAKTGGSIANLLLREAMFGTAQSAKLLVGLADDPTAEEKPEETKPFVSQALRLANEPQWEDENPVAGAERSHPIDAWEG
jgi:hypothetical protein